MLYKYVYYFLYASAIGFTWYGVCYCMCCQQSFVVLLRQGETLTETLVEKKTCIYKLNNGMILLYIVDRQMSPHNYAIEDKAE